MTIRVPSITYDGEEYLLWNEYTAWSWISVSSNQISNTWVTSFNWSTWAVTYTAPVTSVNGSTWAVTVTSDVVVSTQSNNLLTTGMAIWAGTQSNYENLGTYDSNTIYLVVE